MLGPAMRAYLKRAEVARGRPLRALAVMRQCLEGRYGGTAIQADQISLQAVELVLIERNGLDDPLAVHTVQWSLAARGFVLRKRRRGQLVRAELATLRYFHAIADMVRHHCRYHHSFRAEIAPFFTKRAVRMVYVQIDAWEGVVTPTATLRNGATLRHVMFQGVRREDIETKAALDRPLGTVACFVQRKLSGSETMVAVVAANWFLETLGHVRSELGCSP
jgi:hypothetical protein